MFLIRFDISGGGLVAMAWQQKKIFSEGAVDTQRYALYVSNLMNLLNMCFLIVIGLELFGLVVISNSM